jgi:hypothetical protein
MPFPDILRFRCLEELADRQGFERDAARISRPPIRPGSPHVRSLTCREFLLLQTELSQNLQQLSERARSTTEFIQRLKGMTDKVHVSMRAFGVVPF